MGTNVTLINEDILDKPQRIRVEALDLAIKSIGSEIITNSLYGKVIFERAQLFATYITGGKVPSNE
jgi:hypothetical protein